MIMSDLPKDLVEEILSKVPAPTLLKIRSTCKQWNALLNDRKFIEKHLYKSSKQNMKVMLKNYRISLNAVNLHEIINKFDGLSSMVWSKTMQFDFLDTSKFDTFHCDGLLLCTRINHSDIFVWNPCTGNIKSIIPLNDHRCNDTFSCGKTYGFGYGDNIHSRNYKIARVMYCRDIFKIEICDLNSSSWRVLDFAPIRYLKRSSVILRGNTYWNANLACSKEVIICFNFTTEKTEYLNLPIQDDVSQMYSIREQKLAVVFHGIPLEIWVTNEIGPNFVSWSKSFKLDVTKLRGLIVDRYSIFIIDEEKEIVLYLLRRIKERKLRNLIYIFREDGHAEDIGEYSELPVIFTYVPSLVQI